MSKLKLRSQCDWSQLLHENEPSKSMSGSFGSMQAGSYRGTVLSRIGAMGHLPPCAWICITCNRACIFGLPNPLVSKSAGLVSVGHFWRVTPLRLTSCWTQRSAVARCLTRPKPSLLHMPIAAVASEHTVSEVFIPKSFSNDWVPRPSPQARTTAASSLSPLESANVGSVLE